jgi:hypothetical protein
MNTPPPPDWEKVATGFGSQTLCPVVRHPVDSRHGCCLMRWTAMPGLERAAKPNPCCRCAEHFAANTVVLPPTQHERIAQHPRVRDGCPDVCAAPWSRCPWSPCSPVRVLPWHPCHPCRRLYGRLAADALQVTWTERSPLNVPMQNLHTTVGPCSPS